MIWMCAIGFDPRRSQSLAKAQMRKWPSLPEILVFNDRFYPQPRDLDGSFRTHLLLVYFTHT